MTIVEFNPDRWKKDDLCRQIVAIRHHYCWVAPEAWQPRYTSEEVCTKCRERAIRYGIAAKYVKK